MNKTMTIEMTTKYDTHNVQTKITILTK